MKFNSSNYLDSTNYDNVELEGFIEVAILADFAKPIFRTVAPGTHSLTYLGPLFGSNSTNLVDRLNNWTFLKATPKG